MKKQVIWGAVMAILLTACSGNSTDASREKESEIRIPVRAEYALSATDSKADWERTLDQKPTKQKVQLFGKMVDVELGAVKLNSSGTVTMKEGNLITEDADLSEATVVFDMSSFKLAKEKGNGLFDVVKHPNSTLILSNFTDKKANGKLTIEGKSKTVNVEVTSTKEANGYTLKGTFEVNTLDFPLREKVTEKDVNIDKIKVSFDIVYKVR